MSAMAGAQPADSEREMLIESARSLLQKVGRRSARRALQVLEGHEVRIIKSPESVLVMMQIKDAFGTPFCTGEVLVTSAEVAYGEWKGYGLIMGDEPEKAVLMAAIEAVFQGRDKRSRNRLKRWIIRQQRPGSISNACQWDEGMG
jgi:phosphonate C-P lyase system protein PhnG